MKNPSYRHITTASGLLLLLIGGIFVVRTAGDVLTVLVFGAPLDRAVFVYPSILFALGLILVVKGAEYLYSTFVS
jgi:hypothetical protein